MSKESDEVMRQLEDAYTHYEQTAEDLANRAFEKVIKPFCQRRGWEFTSGNGTWWLGFDGRGFSREDRPNDPAFQKICDTLEIIMPGMNQDLGSFMPDYQGE